MSETFKILIDRLKGGQTQKIDEALDPAFFGLNEPELQFKETVQVKGSAYTTDTHLIIHLKAKTGALMPCAVCNEMIRVELKVENFYHAEPLEEIPSAVYEYSEPLREALLIELPRTVECNQGNCAEREILKPYLRTDKDYLPFADLDDLK